MLIKSYAKINLFLEITGYDPSDGYHYIDSLFQEISLFDSIEISEISNENDIIKFENINLNENTTVHKALKLFKNKFDIKKNFLIKINKNIPIGAGLGGGSSNAAYVIKALSKLCNIPLQDTKELFPKIGSDVMFFYYGGLCRVSKKGEVVEPLDYKLNDIYFLIVYPNINISTKWAYSLINNYDDLKNLDDILNLSYKNVDFLQKIVYNKFQSFILNSNNDMLNAKILIDNILDKSILSFMSGSGSSFVYVYNNKQNMIDQMKILMNNTNYKVFMSEAVY